MKQVAFVKQMEPHELQSNTVDELNLTNAFKTFSFFDASLTGVCDFLKHCNAM